MKEKDLLFSTLVLSICKCTYGIFNPKLTVSDCMNNKLTLEIEDAANRGIVYIQGTACRQTTLAGQISRHNFDFAECGIKWHETFQVVIQRKALYQTGDDKRIPVSCYPDIKDLHVGNRLDAIDKKLDPPVNRIVTPVARMSLYSDGKEVSGRRVKLGDQITMTIQLDTEYDEDFDIQAKQCYADNIQIIKDGCPTDDIFPQFTHVDQGHIEAKFDAFRTTNIDGGVVRMPFSCILNVSIGPHPLVVCNNEHEIRDEDRKKRKAFVDSFNDTNVEATIFISTESYSEQYDTPTHQQFSIRQDIFIGITLFLVALFIISLCVNIWLFKKLLLERKCRRRCGYSQALTGEACKDCRLYHERFAESTTTMCLFGFS